MGGESSLGGGRGEQFAGTGIAEHCDPSHGEHILAKFAFQGAAFVMNVDRLIAKPLDAGNKPRASSVEMWALQNLRFCACGGDEPGHSGKRGRFLFKA